MMEQESKVRSQRSEVRSQRSEVRSQRSEVRGQKSEVRGQKSEVRGQKSEVRSQRSEVRSKKPVVMEIPSNVFVFDTPEQLAIAAAERFVDYEYAYHGELGRFSVALAGGDTPRRVYGLLATERFKHRVEWAQVDLFFGDERCVPPDHPDS